MNEMKEYPGYYLTKEGKIYSKRRVKIVELKGFKGSKHTTRTCTYIDGKRIDVAKEVCKMYLPGYNDDENILFKDGDKRNCALSNMVVINDENEAEIIALITSANNGIKVMKINGFKGYYIGENSKVYSINKGYINELAQYVNPRGYLRVKFYDNKHYETHKLMGRTYFNSESLIIHHKDGNKLNNNIDNLVALTEEQHEAKHINEKRVLTQEQADRIKAEYISGDRIYGQNALAKKYGVSPTTIYRIVNGKRY